MAKVASQIDVRLSLTDKMSAGLGKASKSLNAHQKTWNRTAKRINKVGRSFQKVGSSMTKSLTVPIVAAGAAAVKSASDYEDALAKVSTLVDTNEVNMSKMSGSIVELSNKTGVAVTDLSESVYQALSASVDAADAVSFVEQANKLAKGGFTDTASAVDVMTTAINAYGMEATQAEHVADMLITTQNLGKTTVNELASSLGNAIPMASATSTSMENLSAAMSILTKNGIDTATSATSLKGMFSELSKAGSTVDKTLREKTGKSYTQLMKEGKSLGDVIKILSDSVDGDATAFKNLWSNTRAAQAGITLFNTGTKEFNSTLDQMADSVSGAAGATQSAYDTMMNTLSSKVEILKAQFQNLGITIGEKLSPFVDKIVQAMQSLSDWFSNLTDDQINMIITIAGIIAAIGPVILTIGKVISVIGTLVSTIKTIGTAFSAMSAVLAANPVILIIGAIIAVVVALGVIIWKNWDKIKPVLDAIWAKVKEVFGKCVEWIKNTWNNIKIAVQNGVEKVKTFFSNIVNFVKSNWQGLLLLLVNPFAGAFKLLYDNCAGFRNFIDKILNGIKKGVSKAWNAIKTGVINFVNGVKTKFVTGWNAIKTAVLNVVNNMKSRFSNAWSAIKSGVASMVSAVRSKFENLKSKFTEIKTKVEDMKTKFVSAMNKLKNGVKTALQPVINMFNKVKNAIQNVIDKLKNSKLVKWMSGNYSIDNNYNGTDYFRGGLTWVNEKGGELINLPTGTQIIPHDKSLEAAYKQGQRDVTINTAPTLKTSGSTTTISIPKLADTIVVREDADIDKIATALASQLKRTASGYGTVSA